MNWAGHVACMEEKELPVACWREYGRETLHLEDPDVDGKQY